MKRIFQELRWILMILGILASLVVFMAPASAQASTTCTPKATLPADVSDPNAAFDTGAHVIASFNTARQQEGCNVPVNIDPTAYDAASPQQQMLLLVNAERQDRGLGTLQLDTALLSQIQLNHGRELFQYNYFRYFNSNTTTHWVTTGQVASGYHFESTLGSLLSTSQSGAQALYSCVAPGTEDHFVSTDSSCGGQIMLQREGYDYTVAPSGLNTVQIYACHLLRPGNIRDDYVSTDPNCEGFTTDGSLGFVLKAGQVGKGE